MLAKLYVVSPHPLGVVSSYGEYWIRPALHTGEQVRKGVIYRGFLAQGRRHQSSEHGHQKCELLDVTGTCIT